MHTQVHSQSFWCVAVEADRQELRHFSANSHTSSPIATLVLDQNKLNYFTSNIWVQHIRRTALLKLAEVSRTLWETWFGFNKWSLANIILIWINTDFIINMNVIHKSLGLVRLWFLFFFRKKWILLFSKSAFNYLKVTVKTFMLQKTSIKKMLFFWNFYS